MTRFKTRRVLADVTQKKLAEIVGVSQPIVSSWDKGEAFPKPKYWNTIKRVLKVEKIEDLMGERKNAS